MRSLFFIAALLIAAPASVSPALAAPAGSLRVIASPAPAASSSGAGLRGAQTATGAATGAATPATPAPLPPPIQSKAPLAFFAADGQPQAQSVQECRLGCARTYYFCLAGGDAPSCPQNWTSCRATCARNSGPLP